MKRHIILHHTAIQDEFPQAERVKRSHVLRFGQPGTYHYFIERDGETVTFRPEESIGYHAGNWIYNVTGIGICLAGDLREGYQEPTSEQVLALSRLVKDIQKRLSISDANILLHSEVRIGPTSCPGRDMRGVIQSFLTPEEKTEKLAQLQKALRWAIGARRTRIQKQIDTLNS